MSLSWSRALAWRMPRQLLEPVGRESVADKIVRPLAEGTIIKTFAFRGATHRMTPEDGDAYLVLRAASRMWERSAPAGTASAA